LRIRAKEQTTSRREERLIRTLEPGKGGSRYSAVEGHGAADGQGI
jgi:hypothetical protein